MSRMDLFKKVGTHLIGAVRYSIAILLMLLVGPVSPARADTSVCGSITSNTTWTPAGNNYIINCDVQVMSGIKLTIQSGVVVKFDPNTSLQVDGELVAHNATFTSNNTVPNKGDWGRIYFTPTNVDAVFDSSGNYLSGSIIQDSLIEWGGGGVNISGVVEVDIASPYLNHNTIRNNNTSGIRAIGRTTNQPVLISRNQISNNGGPGFSFVGGLGGGVRVSAGKVISNTISNNNAYGGGGIYASASTIMDNSIFSNISGGIEAYGSTLTSNTVTGNTGTGVFASGSSISKNTISGNTSNQNAGGIWAEGNSTVDQNIISINSGVSGGGIHMVGGIMTDNNIEGNTASVGGGVFVSGSTMSENTILNNNAMDGGGIFSENTNIAGNTINGNHASGKGGGLYAYSATTATANQVEGNTAAEGGGIYAVNWYDRLPDISGNTVRDNSASSGGGIYTIEAEVRGNKVVSNTVQSDGGGIYTDGGTLSHNKVSANTTTSFGHASGVYLKNVVDFSYNEVLSNTASGGTAGGISIDGQPQLQYNNLYDNIPYDAEVISSQVVTGTLNYWGTSPCTSIPNQIYDGNDAPPRGKLIYAPSLYLPAPVAQLASPANLSVTSVDSGVTLSWTPLSPIPNVGCRVPGAPGPDLIYLVYYDTDSACAPFNGSGLPSGPSPINAGASSQITLPGASSQSYVFTVTAFDYLGRESSYSNLVGSLLKRQGIYLPMVIK